MSTDHDIKIWDLSIRVFHWLLVAALTFLWWSGTNGEWMDYHPLAGYLVLALVAWRIVWGFIGTRHARFGDFVRGPAQTLRALRSLFAAGGHRYPGHNPVGGWMVVILLVALAFQGVTGLGTTDDLSIDGPLVARLDGAWVERLSGWHRLNADVLVTLAALHVLAVLYHDLVRREGLVRSMLSGRKRGPFSVPAAELPLGRLLFTVAAVAGVAWLLT